MNKEQSPDFRQMTADTIGKDLLGALVQEIRLLPDVWPKLPKAKQDDVIERLRKRVEENVAMAVFTIAAQNRTVVAGSLEQITIKDGVKAVIKFGVKSPNLDGLYEAASDGNDVLVVVAGAKDYIGGMNEIKGDEDQRNIDLDLGHEYHDNDGGGMDGVSDVDPDTGEIKGLPSPDQVKPTVEEMGKAWDDGYQAAEDGKPQSDCPIIRSELVVEWIKGWKAWHEEQSDDKDAA
jgi:ribosome modulation factor